MLPAASGTIGKTTDMGVADKKSAALRWPEAAAFRQNFRIAVNADFVDFFHAHRLQQSLFRHGAVRTIRTGINSNGLHDFLQNTNVHDYMGVALFFQCSRRTVIKNIQTAS